MTAAGTKETVRNFSFLNPTAHNTGIPAGNGRHRSDRKRNTEGRTGRGRYTDGCWVKGFNKKIVRERDNDG